MVKKVSYEKVANSDWYIWQNDDGTFSNEQVVLALLCDIRGELQRLNILLHCRNFKRIPQKLDRIGRNTEKKKRKPSRRHRGK